MSECIVKNPPFKNMTLANLLSESRIIPELASKERWDAIRELVDRLVDSGKVHPQDKETILDSIRQREETMSTGIGFGIAIPHASSSQVDEVVAAFGRSTEGIPFESLDGEPVHFIVLFVVPKDQFQTHLRTLAAIAKFLNDKTVRDELTVANNPATILQVFENRSSRA